LVHHLFADEINQDGAIFKRTEDSAVESLDSATTLKPYLEKYFDTLVHSSKEESLSIDAQYDKMIGDRKTATVLLERLTGELSKLIQTSGQGKQYIGQMKQLLSDYKEADVIN
jgi:hypothetical protein